MVDDYSKAVFYRHSRVFYIWIFSGFDRSLHKSLTNSKETSSRASERSRHKIPSFPEELFEVDSSWKRNTELLSFKDVMPVTRLPLCRMATYPRVYEQNKLYLMNFRSQRHNVGKVGKISASGKKWGREWIWSKSLYEIIKELKKIFRNHWGHF